MTFFWIAVAFGLGISRYFIKGKLEWNVAGIYKALTHIILGMAIMYFLFVPSIVGWVGLGISTILEVIFALRDNPELRG